MCLLIFSPDISKSTIKVEDLKRAFERNSDGAGLAYVKNNKVVIDKGYFRYKSFLHAYERVSRSITGPLMIHFRLATSGKKDTENTHPMFIYQDKLCMGHNGVFTELNDRNADYSDTVKLAQILGDVGWSFPFNETQEIMIEMLCGGYNKLVFLDNKGLYKIINESAGTWRDGTWYSNTYSFSVTTPIYPYTPYQSTHIHPTGGGFGSSTYETDTSLNDWSDELTEAEIDALCNDDSCTSAIAGEDIELDEDEIVNEYEEAVDKYIKKYPGLFDEKLVEERRQRLKRLKEKNVQTALALLPGVQDAIASHSNIITNNVIPINDKNNVFFTKK